MRQIQYFRDPETKFLITRVGSYIAIPVCNYEEILSQGDFRDQYPLEKHDVISVSKWHNTLIPISNRKIRDRYTIAWINYHRQFWGLKSFSQS